MKSRRMTIYSRGSCLIPPAHPGAEDTAGCTSAELLDAPGGGSSSDDKLALESFPDGLVGKRKSCRPTRQVHWQDEFRCSACACSRMERRRVLNLELLGASRASAYLCAAALTPHRYLLRRRAMAASASLYCGATERERGNERKGGGSRGGGGGGGDHRQKLVRPGPLVKWRRAISADQCSEASCPRAAGLIVVDTARARGAGRRSRLRGS